MSVKKINKAKKKEFKILSSYLIDLLRSKQISKIDIDFDFESYSGVCALKCMYTNYISYRNASIGRVGSFALSAKEIVTEMLENEVLNYKTDLDNADYEDAKEQGFKVYSIIFEVPEETLFNA